MKIFYIGIFNIAKLVGALDANKNISSSKWFERSVILRQNETSWPIKRHHVITDIYSEIKDW